MLFCVAWGDIGIWYRAFVRLSFAVVLPIFSLEISNEYRIEELSYHRQGYGEKAQWLNGFGLIHVTPAWIHV